MPVTSRTPLRRLSQQEFGDIAYEVVGHVFAIHNEMGRFFDEKIYKRELAQRMPGVQREEPIEVIFGTFRKPYFLDVLLAGGALFEFKAVEAISERHRAQLLNYVYLCDFAHSQLINVRPESVHCEFVNTSIRFADRQDFAIDADRWSESVSGASSFYDFLIAFLHDLGTGLEISLYEEALVHCFGGKEKVEVDVSVSINGHSLGSQPMRLIAPGVAFKITAFDGSLAGFEIHARRLLAHVDLRAIVWANIAMKKVTFITLIR